MRSGVRFESKFIVSKIFAFHLYLLASYWGVENSLLSSCTDGVGISTLLPEEEGERFHLC